MRSVAIALTLGILWLQQQASLLTTRTLIAVVFVSCGLLLCVFKLHLPYVRRAAALLAAALIGIAWADWRAELALQTALPATLEGRDLLVTGVIASLPGVNVNGSSFQLDVEMLSEFQPAQTGAAQVPLPGLQQLPSRISLFWPARAGEAPLLQAGQRWRLPVHLKRPHGNQNPGGFDAELWMLEQGVRATGSVQTAQSAAIQPLQDFVPGVLYAIDRCRGWLRERIHAALPGKPYAAVVVALVIGDQREIRQVEWTIFQRSGIGHLISISGLHITMLAGFFALLMGALWRRSFFIFHARPLPLRLPVQKVMAVTAAVVAVLYVALAGFGVPAQRTMYMLLTVAVAIWTGRFNQFSSVLALALCVVLVIDPWALMWPGFWLSFVAVAVILYVARDEVAGSLDADSSWRARLHRNWHAALRTQYGITLGLLPLTMLLFAQISLISPLANAFAIPLVSFLVTPLVLLAVFLPAPFCGWLLHLAHAGIALMAELLTWLSAPDWVIWTAPQPALPLFLLATAGMLWLLGPRALPMRWMGLVCIIPVLLPVQSPVSEAAFRATVLDVGQGTAVLIQTRQHTLLYDTGPAYGPDSDAGSRVILPFLRAQGIRKLDRMLISHQDSDHSGGAASILAQMTVDGVISSLPGQHALRQSASPHSVCVAGQSWQWDGVTFEMLQPTAASYASDKWKPNARSCTLKISTPRLSMLLPGDAEAIQEDEMLHMLPEKLPATVLLAPDHGSGTSSTDAFLQAVHPELIVIQSGYLNRYHHPKPLVLERYQAFGINHLRTDEAGAIELDFEASLHISEYRKQHARYWYGQ
ncbi:DNA internalization-related competence protein ComEC/Rec2 [Undibacterium rugosum]|uniref:DNA internalization-related competence protein ComEC/Rec2 n=1 Tax=Undibacterium rugosum TaxID=2762291 RepID=UPI001B821558|nr:DNA internalization-related competence protein ComEC/Rec2 [Undibacterium rugosum]MBR7778917.1 DNA internalization-related competence protein ComEC/Rec2 [Undibacterium rugosum]